jgi:hypothetical protein
MFGYPIEKHASKLYTPAVFKLFKDELKKTASYVIVDNSDGLCYEVLHVDSENRESWSRVNFTITIDPQLGLYKCQCRLYEHFGIICCHIMLVQRTLKYVYLDNSLLHHNMSEVMPFLLFQVMTQTGVMKIPECHIMKRWTVDARKGSNVKNGNLLQFWIMKQTEL